MMVELSYGRGITDLIHEMPFYVKILWVNTDRIPEQV